jgi:hypothetical protein
MLLVAAWANASAGSARAIAVMANENTFLLIQLI